MEITNFAKLLYSALDIDKGIQKALNSISQTEVKSIISEDIETILTAIKDDTETLKESVLTIISDIQDIKKELSKNASEDTEQESPSDDPEITEPEEPEAPIEPNPEVPSDDGAVEDVNYILSTVPELSGLCLDPEGNMYGVSDSQDTHESGIYKINKETGESELFVGIDADLEGITCDPDGNFYVCTEDLVTINDGIINHTTWDPDENSNFTYFIIKVTPEKEISILGLVVVNLPEVVENNKGLEGIAYYGSKTFEVDGATDTTYPLLLLGVLKKPTTLMLWDPISDSTTIPTCLISGEDAPTEIADLYYDNEYLYILDSKTAIIYKYTVNINETNIELTLHANEDYTSIIDMNTIDPDTGAVFNDGNGENPEALCGEGDTMYIGCDYNSKIYKVNKI